VHTDSEEDTARLNTAAETNTLPSTVVNEQPESSTLAQDQSTALQQNQSGQNPVMPPNRPDAEAGQPLSLETQARINHPRPEVS
jgi:hypothetical protein